MSRNKNKKVMDAFSADDLARVCELPEAEFAPAYGLDVTGDGARGDDFYAFRDNGREILAVAHLDTVVRPHERTARFEHTKNGLMVRSGALDDRLGAYILLELLPKLGIQHDVLLTTGEEQGCSTAEYFTPAKDYRWMIEFDRGGTDVVMYQYDDFAARSAVEAAGARPGDGIFSDIAFLEHLGVKGFNWGVGYRDYHSTRGHAYLTETFTMVRRYLRFHQLHANVTMPHVPSLETESEYGWLLHERSDNRYEQGAGSYGDEACWHCAEPAVNERTGFCENCDTCQYCGEMARDCTRDPRDHPFDYADDDKPEAV